MTKKLIALAGVSGSGKTYRRTTDPALNSLPCVDVADIYQEYPEFDYTEVYGTLFKRIERLLEEHDTVATEAYFIPGSVTRYWLVNWTEMNKVELQFIDLHEKLELCRQRVKDSGMNVEKRLEILERVYPRAQAVYRRVEHEHS